MEETFEKLKKEGKNTLDNIIHWFKEAHIIDGAKESEEKARKMFEDVADKSKIEWEVIKNNMHKLADDGKKNVEEVKSRLGREGPKLLEALKASVHAFKDTMSKK